jgi:hypothetical protein
VSFLWQIGDIVNRLTVTLPRPRDGKVREASIPDSVRVAREAAKAAKAAGAGRAGAGAGAGMGDSDEEEEDDGEDMGVMPKIAGSGPGGAVLMKDLERERGVCVCVCVCALAVVFCCKCLLSLPLLPRLRVRDVLPSFCCPLLFPFCLRQAARVCSGSTCRATLTLRTHHGRVTSSLRSWTARTCGTLWTQTLWSDWMPWSGKACTINQLD